jgi:hypothetical protein
MIGSLSFLREFPKDGICACRPGAQCPFRVPGMEYITNRRISEGALQPPFSENKRHGLIPAKKYFAGFG